MFVDNGGGPPEFSRQHDVRRALNGNITLYDNGTFHDPQFSRAVEYELDEVNMTATVVWQYRNTPEIYSRFLGSTQRLPNGNTVIGWGGTTPTVTEIWPGGEKAFELTFDTVIYSYRVFRDQWEGKCGSARAGRDGGGGAVSSGVYFVRLASQGQIQTKKIVLLK